MDKSDFISFIHSYQDRLCKALEDEDGDAEFATDKWERPDGGGGITRVIEKGKVFEKGGVNTSVVHGNVTPALEQQLQSKGKTFFACGVSVVIHPLSPMVPTVHANFRYFEMMDGNGATTDRWFGGGCDLTPYYLFEQDVTHFHSKFNTNEWYPLFKKNCDEYFLNKHRGERRGVGGIFYDYIRPDDKHSADYWLAFTKTNADAFIDAYLPIVQKRRALDYTERHLHWQEIRRGRYVEFNLIHDRGTLFGLRSGGRTESILMSLPPRVRFEYNDQPPAGSEEAKLLDALRVSG
ncbi:MAG TPA: oxygen-dependent coproporphyrinogen oxidase [Cyclobacteriaceae bacterium]